MDLCSSRVSGKKKVVSTDEREIKVNAKSKARMEHKKCHIMQKQYRRDKMTVEVFHS